MQKLSLIWGIVAIIGMIIGLFPFLGPLNWLTMIFSIIGMIIGVIAIIRSDEENRRIAIIGMILCIIAALVGVVRLIVGGGIV
jgi:hypothetical protein